MGTKIDGERSYATRNRRGHPPTTLMDELVAGKRTGAIVSGYRIAEGRAVSHYVNHPDSAPDFALVDFAEYARSVVQWRTERDPPAAEQHAVPAGGYIGVTRGIEELPREAIKQAVREGRRITSEVIQAAAADILGPAPLELAPLELRRAAPKQPIHVQEEVNTTAVYVLTFDGPYGPESKEFASAREAGEYPQVLRDYFKRDCFGNFQLFREYRSPREQLDFGEL